jgi:hypothetical protein
MNECSISQNDWRFLALIAGIPECLAGEWEKAEFIEKDLNDMIEIPMEFKDGFEEFQDGTHVGDYTHAELLEYAQAMKIELQELAQQLLARAELIEQAITFIVGDNDEDRYKSSKCGSAPR